MKQTLSFIFILVFFQFLSQNTYFVKDQYSKEPVPFSKIIPENGIPVLTDIDGAFQLNDTLNVSIKITSFGYRDTIVLFSDIIDNSIFINQFSKEMDEIIILPGENPAHRIMNLVIENRKKNNPTENDAFRYESYSKFVFDINQEALTSISDSTKDSSLIKIRKFFNSQHLFLIENASKRTFIPPSRDKEEIIAYKVSGFSDPMFSTFANEMQSFSFYENQFELLGKTYINPIAFGGTKRYLFIIEDTTIIGLDTTFTISFRPRKGKNFDGLKGRLFVNTNGYAIEKVITEPYDNSSNMPVKIIQEYIFVNGEKWFPSKLSTEISFPAISLNTSLKDGYVQGKGNTYIKNIEFNPKGIKKYSFDNAVITTAEKANEISEKAWDSLRIYSMNEKEKRTYKSVDSLSKEINLDYKLSLLKTLLEGKIPLGYLNLDLMRVYDYKQYEGSRFGLGLETSKKVMKSVKFGGYFGYGTRDKEWKYGAYSDIHLYKQKGIKIHLNYQQDIAERGGTFFQKDVFNLNSPDLFRRIYIKNMDRQRLAEIALSGNITSNFKLSFIGNYQHISTTEGYQYIPQKTSIYFPNNNFNLAETSLEVIWNIKEKVMILGDTRISKGTKFPKISMQITKGWKGWALSNYDYVRLHAEIGQEVSVRGAGKITWLITAGQTIGDVPLYLSQLAIGTGKNLNLSIKNTFETMTPSEFYSSQQASLFTRFSFTTLKTSKKWCKPQFVFHHAMGFGTMQNRSEHVANFKTMEKGFYEGGIIIDKLFINGFSGFGLGTFYRYGSYSDANWQKNFMIKISFSISI